MKHYPEDVYNVSYKVTVLKIFTNKYNLKVKHIRSEHIFGTWAVFTPDTTRAERETGTGTRTRGGGALCISPCSDSSVM